MTQATKSAEPTPYKFWFFFGLNVAFFAWLVMLAAGAIWHLTGAGSPIGFTTALPAGAALMVAAFLATKR